MPPETHGDQYEDDNDYDDRKHQRRKPRLYYARHF